MFSFWTDHIHTTMLLYSWNYVYFIPKDFLTDIIVTSSQNERVKINDVVWFSVAVIHYHFGFVEVWHSFDICEVWKESSEFKQYIHLALVKC